MMFHRCPPSHQHYLISLSKSTGSASCAQRTSLQSNPRVSLSPFCIATALITRDAAPVLHLCRVKTKICQSTQAQREKSLCSGPIHADPSRAQRDFEWLLVFTRWHMTVHRHFQEGDTEQSQEASNSEWTPGRLSSPQDSHCRISLQNISF